MTEDKRILEIREIVEEVDRGNRFDFRDIPSLGDVVARIRAILDSPPPASETEWGWKTRERTYRAQWGEADARRTVAEGYPGMRTLIRREVGPWTEVQP